MYEDPLEMFDLIMGPKVPQESLQSAQLGGSAHVGLYARLRFPQSDIVSSRCRVVARTLIDSGQDARRASHVAAVLLTKGLDHHRFLALHAEKKKRPEADEAGRPRNPVRQQECLRQRPQPERRIHGMPHPAIDTAYHQCVLLAHFERYRPIAPEVLVRAVKQP